LLVIFFLCLTAGCTVIMSGATFTQHFQIQAATSHHTFGARHPVTLRLQRSFCGQRHLSAWLSTQLLGSCDQSHIRPDSYRSDCR
jgi:hypothetical protein